MWVVSNWISGDLSHALMRRVNCIWWMSAKCLNHQTDDLFTYVSIPLTVAFISSSSAFRRNRLAVNTPNENSTLSVMSAFKRCIELLSLSFVVSFVWQTVVFAMTDECCISLALLRLFRCSSQSNCANSFAESIFVNLSQLHVSFEIHYDSV